MRAVRQYLQTWVTLIRSDWEPVGQYVGMADMISGGRQLIGLSSFTSALMRVKDTNASVWQDLIWEHYWFGAVLDLELEANLIHVQGCPRRTGV